MEIWKYCLIVDEWLFNEMHAGICDSGIIIKSCGNEMGGKKISLQTNTPFLCYYLMIIME